MDDETKEKTGIKYHKRKSAFSTKKHDLVPKNIFSLITNTNIHILNTSNIYILAIKQENKWQNLGQSGH